MHNDIYKEWTNLSSPYQSSRALLVERAYAPYRASSIYLFGGGGRAPKGSIYLLGGGAYGRACLRILSLWSSASGP